MMSGSDVEGGKTWQILELVCVDCINVHLVCGRWFTRWFAKCMNPRVS